ncbi:unnamed protein product [Spirodela intermedia]|uniref:phenylalanine--tRNA ligase n=1 Tax=Spirodela intermedia TaxID=51605 RepID=A0A7I8JDY8_SPIIN|nr:unnamed protein product [Spirodela intermedia]CAA6668221.1 unnamed protein product [Spirodela intermedia]
MARTEEAVLEFLHSNEEIPDSHQFATSLGLLHGELENVIKSLHGFQLVVAQAYVSSGSPEAQLFFGVPPEGISTDELKRKLGDGIFKIGSAQARKNGWIDIGKQGVTRKTEHIEDRVKDLLNKIKNGEAVSDGDVADVKKRKLIDRQIWKGYSLTKGPKYTIKRKRVVTDLTREILLRGDWKDLEFKEYNLNAGARPLEYGCDHPLLKVREQFQNIFLQMGFAEMPTNKFVESSFWNFDALFQPQQHPARDSHDTFFLRAPSTTRQLPEDYVEKVKCVHESGGFGSKGCAILHLYIWVRLEEAEANKNVLRTHTTAVSSRMLYLLAQDSFTPKKYFSIDRVFRNEAVDRTHLASLICDRGLTLGDLKGVLRSFFARLGISKLRFKPAYNPYTEPSMEIFSYHEGLKKWVEIGNSGMFRPEMLLPMGLPEDVSVIAWIFLGFLLLNRPTMILYGIDNIRDLFGHKVDLNLIKENPICRLGMDYPKISP